MSFGMNPEALHAAGKSIGGFEGEARTAGKGFLTSVDSAKAAVHHARLTTALDSYHGEWSGKANGLPQQVTTAGAKISDTAVDGRQTDNDASADGTRAGAQTQSNSGSVRRPINVPG